MLAQSHITSVSFALNLRLQTMCSQTINVKKGTWMQSTLVYDILPGSMMHAVPLRPTGAN